MDPCTGDAGGGLFTSVGNKWLLRGITSVSILESDRRCNFNTPVVYTNIEHFSDWIGRILNGNVKSKSDVIKFDRRECDRSLARVVGTVINGRISEPNKRPWLVALHTTIKEKLFGGGSLISERFVLTAAHVLQNKFEEMPKNPDDVVVYLGRWNLTDKTDENVLDSPEKFFIHPDWKPFDQIWDADIALIKLYNDVRFSDKIRPVCLWTPKHAAIRKRYRGLTENQSFYQHSDVPREVRVYIRPISDCYEDDYLGNVISNRSICVGGEGKGPCSGDSGGGLFSSMGDRLLLRGIISLSTSDYILGCDINRPAVYTNVANFTNWIEEILNGDIKI